MELSIFMWGWQNSLNELGLAEIDEKFVKAFRCSLTDPILTHPALCNAQFWPEAEKDRVGTLVL
jgi:hypothetical protein